MVHRRQFCCWKWLNTINWVRQPGTVDVRLSTMVCLRPPCHNIPPPPLHLYSTPSHITAPHHYTTWHQVNKCHSATSSLIHAASILTNPTSHLPPLIHAHAVYITSTPFITSHYITPHKFNYIRLHHTIPHCTPSYLSTTIRQTTLHHTSPQVATPRHTT